MNSSNTKPNDTVAAYYQRSKNKQLSNDRNAKLTRVTTEEEDRIQMRMSTSPI